tara:strand:+ start:87 stop:428 length:342 start_codon:yes stop_codon:yes gene_type:complete
MKLKELKDRILETIHTNAKVDWNWSELTPKQEFQTLLRVYSKWFSKYENNAPCEVELRKNLASLIKDLLRDHESMEKSSDIAYDVGQITAYCHVLKKKKLSNMICEKFYQYTK